MAAELFAHDASTTVSAGGTDAPSGGTSQSWTAASSAAFPAAATGTSQFHIADPAAPTELILVTNVSGTTWTVTRGADSTTPVTHSAGFTVYQVVAASTLTPLGAIAAANGVAQLSGSGLLPLAQGGTAAATQQAALDSIAGAVTSGRVLAGDGTHVTLRALATADVPDQAWQFRPESYGAKGDGKVIADAVLASSTTLTSASAAFTSGDTGKYIMINGAIGTTNIPLITTITYVNATTVTLGSTATVSGSAFPAVYGTDDTAAVNSAIGAAKTYALANGFYGEVLFGPKIYILGSGPTQTTSPAVQNSQLQIPFPNVNGSTQKLVIALTGTGDGHVQYWESTTPNVSGTALVSMTTAPSSADGTYGNQSVLGGPSGGGAFTGGYANTKAVVTGISVWCPAYTNQYAFDFAYLGGIYMRQCSAHIFAAPGVGGGKSPLIKDLVADSNFQNKIGVGMRTPVMGNNADCVVDSFTSEGYSRALYVYDHLTASRIFAFYSDVALKIDTGLGAGGVEHLISIANFGCEQFNGGISTTGSGGPFVPVSINMDAEVASPAYDISDAGNILHGSIQWDDTTRTDPAVSGASNVKIVNASRGPGVWSGAPAVPATTVAATNTAYRDATVYLTSGGAAVSVIKVNATTTGLTLSTSGTVTVRVPAGATVTLTYASTAPTWVWVLE